MQQTYAHNNSTTTAQQQQQPQQQHTPHNTQHTTTHTHTPHTTHHTPHHTPHTTRHTQQDTHTNSTTTCTTTHTTTAQQITQASTPKIARRMNKKAAAARHGSSTHSPHRKKHFSRTASRARHVTQDTDTRCHGLPKTFSQPFFMMWTTMDDKSLWTSVCSFLVGRTMMEITTDDPSYGLSFFCTWAQCDLKGARCTK